MSRVSTKSTRIVPCFVTAIALAIIAPLNLLYQSHSNMKKSRVWKRKVSGTILILWTPTLATKIHLTAALPTRRRLRSNHLRLESLPELVVYQETTGAVHVVASG